MGRALLLACISALILTGKASPVLIHDVPIWRDPNATVHARVADLLSVLTLDEKIGLMDSHSWGVPRLDIANFTWGNECLHGVVGHSPDIKTTVFPQPIGLGASFNEPLVQAIATAVSDEVRALSNAGKGDEGLSCWAPNINIFRDPRWGRGSETYGEDPILTSLLAAAYVRGLQGSVNITDSAHSYLKLIATPKHFAAYSLEEFDGISRHEFNAWVDPEDMADTYLPAWDAIVDAGAASVMCSYNEVNGTPACANSELIADELRGRMGFDGHVVSDCGAVIDIFQNHRYASSLANATAEAVRAGTDVDCGAGYVGMGGLHEALAAGLLNTSDIDLAAGRSLTNRFRIGEFDPPELVPWRSIPLSVVNSPEHVELAARAARESMVLLKNEGNLLPLQLEGPNGVRKIAVIGPAANNTELLLGNYHGQPLTEETPLSALTAAAERHNVSVGYQEGAAILGEGVWMFENAVALARDADVVVLFVGLSMEKTTGDMLSVDQVKPAVEKESLDRTTLTLPDVQADLVKALAKQTDTPIVLVLVNGGPVAVEFEAASPRVGAILESWYGGQAAGSAIVDTLLGVNAPAGRLPVTVYKADYVTQILPSDMRMRAGVGRTHRFLTVPPLYEFGYGLSYTTFGYSSLRVAKDAASASVLVANTGKVDSDHVVLAFLTAAGDAARQRLAGFTRVRVAAGESVQAVVQLNTDSRALRGALQNAGGRAVLRVGDLSVPLIE